MTRDDVIAMAKEAGRWAVEEFHRRWLAGDGCACQDIRDEKFAALAATAEREKCLAAALDEASKLIRPLEDVNLDAWHVRRLQEQSNGAMKAYEAIRARGQESHQTAIDADNERDHAEEDASIAAGRLQACIAGRVV